MDSPSAQLSHDLRAATTCSLRLQRPLLHHLNADTSWLLQIPRPSTSSNARSRSHKDSRKWYTILIDPWLEGSQVDVASWFSQQWHTSKSSVSSVAKIEELARHIEELSNAADTKQGGDTSAAPEDATVESQDCDLTSVSSIDLVVISHEFSDHCHKETLLSVSSDIPVLATTQAASLIQSWKHFRDVQEIPSFSGSGADYRERSLSPLPEWVSISRLVGSYDPIALHSALMIAFDVHSDRYGVSDGAHSEAIIYSPHGIHASSLQPVAEAEPRVQTLALVHGLHVVELSKVRLNLGAHNGLEAQRTLKAKYWVGTHDEEKLAQGLVGRLLNRKVLSFKDALLAERRKRAEGNAKVDEQEVEVEVDDDLDDANFMQLKNGERVVLV